MRWSWILGCLWALSGCGSCSQDAPSPVEPEVSLPSSTLGRLHVRGGERMLTALREQIGGGRGAERVAAAALPRTTGDLLRRLVPVPAAVAARVRDDSDLEGLLLGSADDGAQVYACHVQVEASPEHPLGAEVLLGETLPGQPRARWITGVEAGALALAGDVLVAGSSREAVIEALPWLRRRAFEERAEEGASLWLSDGVISRSVHSILRAAVDRWAAEARESLDRERARHAGAPQVADPEVALSRTDAALRELVALLPDIGEVELSLTAPSAGPTLSLRAQVTPGSPLASRLGAQESFETGTLWALPEGSSLRLVTALGPATVGPGSPGLVGGLIGDRMDDAARVALEGLLASIDDGESVRAVAVQLAAGRWAGYYLGHSTRPLDLGQLDAALGSRWLRAGLGFALGCDPGRLARAAGVSCDPAERRLDFASAGETRLVALRPASETDALGASAARFERGEQSGLDPTTERLLRALPERSVLAIWVDGAALFAVATGAPSPRTSAPVALAVAAEGGALRADLILAPGAGAKLFALLLPLAARVGAGPHGARAGDRDTDGAGLDQLPDEPHR